MNIQRHVNRLRDALSAKTEIGGLPIVDIYGEGRKDHRLLRVVERACLLFEREQPVAYRHFLKNVVKVEISALHARGHYDKRDRTVRLSGALVKRGNPYEVAMVLIHEAAHARVHAWGVVNASLEDRTREEILCERRERAFGLKLARQQAVWQHYMDKRAQMPTPRAPTEDEFYKLWKEDKLEEATHVGSPLWIVKALLKFGDHVRTANAARPE